jgi:hypothetical protein
MYLVIGATASSSSYTDYGLEIRDAVSFCGQAGRLFSVASEPAASILRVVE